MKFSTAGTISGCMLWLIVFGIFSSCILPTAMVVGRFTATSDFALQTIEPILCLEGTTAKLFSYETTTTDRSGNSRFSTVYELYCVYAQGGILKKDFMLYASLWIGLVTSIGLSIAVLLAIVLFVPFKVLITKRLNRIQKQENEAVIGHQ
jgi:hypothetical protein